MVSESLFPDSHRAAQTWQAPDERLLTDDDRGFPDFGSDRGVWMLGLTSLRAIPGACRFFVTTVARTTKAAWQTARHMRGNKTNTSGY
jgi:hypothetical protein